MAQSFRLCDRDQALLMPSSLRDWLAQDDLAWCVLDVVAKPRRSMRPRMSSSGRPGVMSCHARWPTRRRVGRGSIPTILATRVLALACKAAGVGWAGFHTFRHTVASRLFAEGRNVVQVQRWLGHYSAGCTLDTYVHLLDNDLGEPLQAAPWAT
jgi:integrase